MESSTWSAISRSLNPPHNWIKRSDRVDLPWSMWAMMEKFRIRSTWDERSATANLRRVGRPGESTHARNRGGTSQQRDRHEPIRRRGARRRGPRPRIVPAEPAGPTRPMLFASVSRRMQTPPPVFQAADPYPTARSPPGRAPARSVHRNQDRSRCRIPPPSGHRRNTPCLGESTGVAFTSRFGNTLRRGDPNTPMGRAPFARAAARRVQPTVTRTLRSLTESCRDLPCRAFRDLSHHGSPDDRHPRSRPRG